MKITRDHFMFLYQYSAPHYAHAGACRFVMFNYQRNLGRKLMFPNLNNVDTSCNEPSS